MRAGSLAVSLTLVLALVSPCGATPHAPIAIASDADFTAENGVIGGSGTPDDPYIIAGWEIDAGGGTGIMVRGVEAYLVIENCFVQGNPRGTGISVSTSPHITVRNCRFESLGTGIFLYESPGAVLLENEFVACWIGIQGNASPGLLVKGNFFRDARKHGLFLWRARGSRLAENLASNCGVGIYLDSCNRLAITGNVVRDCSWGIYLWDSHDCTLTLNALVNCKRGLGLYHTSARNLIYHNAFVDCDLPAFDDSSGSNLWYAPYPKGGNFWGGLELVDRYSGSRQDELGPDGIGDTPVKIPETGHDRYPLMVPPPGIPAYGKGEEG